MIAITRLTVTPPMLVDFSSLFEPLKARAVEVVFNQGDYPLDAVRLAELVGESQAAIIGLDEVSGEFFARCPHLRVVARNGVGMDSVDMDAATRAGVLVTAPLGANSTSVAELALGLLIALVRHVIPTHNRLQAGVWRRTQGMELTGKTLGIIGLGRVGKKVARRAQSFGLQVIANDIAPDVYFARENQVEMVGFEEILARSDIISLHVPLTSLTRQMFDRAAFAQTKPGVYLINTARGAVVDSTALAQALDSGQVAGAALDVHSVEGEIDAPLAGRDNVITTTHLGAYTRESLYFTTEMAVQSILQLMDGQQPTGLMNPELWPRGNRPDDPTT